MSAEEMEQKRLENRLRKRARTRGFGIKKSRGSYSIDNHQEYMVFDINRNAIVLGEKFDVTLEQIAEFLDEHNTR